MPFPWPEAVQKLFVIAGAGTLRAVGGCVRDALLGQKVKDIDLATTHTPDAMTELLHKNGVSVKPTGIAHGTITAVLDGHAFEITTLRRDVEPDGRRAVVAFTTDWTEDAQRRDFTVNALYADASGVVYDPLDAGLDDLEARRLRFIGTPEERIHEDYLRILRFFRFMAQLPDFAADKDALAGCAALKGKLATLSRERVTAEWLKLVTGAQAAQAIRLLDEAGVNAIYPHHKDAATRLAARPDFLFPSRALALALTFENQLPDSILLSNDDRRTLDSILKLGPSAMSWQEIAYRHGNALAADAAAWRHIIKSEPLDWDLYKDILAYAPPRWPGRSADFIAQGLSGPALGAAMKESEETWIAETFLRFIRN